MTRHDVPRSEESRAAVGRSRQPAASARLVVHRRRAGGGGRRRIVRWLALGCLLALASLAIRGVSLLAVGGGPSGPEEVSSRWMAYQLARWSPPDDRWFLELPKASCLDQDSQARSWRAGSRSVALAYALAADDRPRVRESLGDLFEIIGSEDAGSDLTLAHLRLHWALTRDSGPRVLWGTSYARAERLLRDASLVKVYRLGQLVEGERLAARSGRAFPWTAEGLLRGDRGPQAMTLDETRVECLRGLKTAQALRALGSTDTPRVVVLEDLSRRCAAVSRTDC